MWMLFEPFGLSDARLGLEAMMGPKLTSDTPCVERGK